MSRIKHLMSFVYEFFHANVKKSSIPKCHELSLRCHFYRFFPWKCQKKLDTQMSEIKHPMSVLYGFFHGNVKKSSIPKCQKLSIPCQFCMDFSMEMSKKARYPNVTNYASHVSFIFVFPWKRPKKLDTQMSRIKHLMSFVYGFFHENVKKKLDTQMSQIMTMSVLYSFFHENVQKSSIPKCQELSIWCHLYMDFSMKMSKKSSIPKCQELSIRCHFYLDFSMIMSKRARYPNVKN